MTPDTSYQRIQQEARELRRRNCASLRLLQFLQVPFDHSLHPAMEAGVTDSQWTTADLVEMIESK